MSITFSPNSHTIKTRPLGPLPNGLLFGILPDQAKHLIPTSTRSHYHIEQVQSQFIKNIGKIYLTVKPIEKDHQYQIGYVDPCSKAFCFRCQKYQTYTLDMAEIFHQFLYYYQQNNLLNNELIPNALVDYFEDLFENFVWFLESIVGKYSDGSVFLITNLGALTCLDIILGEVNHLLIKFGQSDGDSAIDDNQIVTSIRNLTRKYHKKILAGKLTFNLILIYYEIILFLLIPGGILSL